MLVISGIFGNPHLVEELDKDFDRVVPISLLYDQTANNVDFVSKQIRKFYFGDKKIDESCRQNVTNVNIFILLHIYSNKYLIYSLVCRSLTMM